MYNISIKSSDDPSYKLKSTDLFTCKKNDITTPADGAEFIFPTIHQIMEVQTSYGNIIVDSVAERKIFNFEAKGMDERALFVTMVNYIKEEFDAGRDVHCTLGIGKFGMDGNGIRIDVPPDRKFTFLGSGKQTCLGFVGKTSLTANFFVLKISGKSGTNIGTQDILSAVVAADNVTVTIGIAEGHAGTVGSRCRVYQADTAGVIEGTHEITATTATSVTFVTRVSAVVSLGVAPRISIFNHFANNVEVGNFTLFDDDPVAHNGADESHGMLILNHLNPMIRPIWGEGIGDEVVELISCESAHIDYISGKSAPSIQSSGGGTLSIKNGCHNTTIGALIVRDPFAITSRNLTYGLSIKTAGNTTTITGLLVHSLVANYPEESAVNFDCSGADISGVDIYGLRATGGKNAITRTGIEFKLSDVNIYSMKANKQTVRAVNMQGTITSQEDIVFYKPQANGALLTGSRELFRLDGNNCRMFDINLSNAAVAWIANSTSNMLVKGGVADNVGGSGNGAIPFKDVNTPPANRTAVVDGVSLINSDADKAGFFGLLDIRNCPIIEFNATPVSGVQTNCSNFNGNKKVNAWIRLGASNGSLNYNEFIGTVGQGRNGVLGMILVSGNDTQVIGNKAPNLSSGNAIVEDFNQNRNLIVFNNMNGRPYVFIDLITTKQNSISNI